jgi:N-dimethylarginine dimethylaminohydrolase
MELEKFSAYHGKNWRQRKSSHAEECASTTLWRPSYGSDSEFGALKEVLLFAVGANYPKVTQPDEIQFLRPVDKDLLQQELDTLAKTFLEHGVNVKRISDDFFPQVSPNLLFCRDLFFLSPYGAIVSRMASEIRAGEEKWAQLALAKEGIPILKTISGKGIFEGADALWLNPKLLVVGLGNRTNEDGFHQVQETMSEFGVECVSVTLPKSVQHLLGILQLTAKNKAFVRQEKAPQELLHLLDLHHIQTIFLKETDEIREKQALNFVCLAENKILMAKDCPQTKKIFTDHGLEVAAEVQIQQLLAAAGGIACATAILARKLRFSGN